MADARKLTLAAAILCLSALYLSGLSRMGLVSKDEPRYADIGRAMAQTGDWVTPRLSGTPWFEKPPLLYWLESAGFLAGLGPETAPRLPVALFSVGFVLFFWRKVRKLWDEPTANFATAILSTSAGWIAFSHVAVTDIPVAVMFSAAVLLALDRRITAAAAALGFAVLAKSLVPLVLFLPVLALDYRRWRDWVRPVPILVFLAVTLPWHVLCYLRNGNEFLKTLFLQQQFGRFFSPERQHVQKWWFYIPVLLLLLIPWFPFLPQAFRKDKDPKTRTLLAVFLFGFVFFSASLNKLPGYLLPLIPCLTILMARSAPTTGAVALTAAVIGAFPIAAAILPQALAESLPQAFSATTFHPWQLLLPGALGTTGVFACRYFLKIDRKRLSYLAALAAAAFLWLEISILPQVDRATSARSLWQQTHPACVPAGLDRGLKYGLSYYASRPLPDCDVLDQAPRPVVR